MSECRRRREEELKFLPGREKTPRSSSPRHAWGNSDCQSFAPRRSRCFAVPSTDVIASATVAACGEAAHLAHRTTIFTMQCRQVGSPQPGPRSRPFVRTLRETWRMANGTRGCCRWSWYASGSTRAASRGSLWGMLGGYYRESVCVFIGIYICCTLFRVTVVRRLWLDFHRLTLSHSGSCARQIPEVSLLALSAQGTVYN